jgi:hypothetical protein
MKWENEFLASCFFQVTIPDENEFAVFTHVKGKVYTDFNEIRQEIETETDRIGGKKVRKNLLLFMSILFLLHRISLKNR